MVGSRFGKMQRTMLCRFFQVRVRKIDLYFLLVEATGGFRIGKY